MDALVLANVEKQYGGLRPLRIRALQVPKASVTMLLGFDRPAAEIFVNLITGAVLPDQGDIVSLGRSTAAIVSGDEWLSFVERFGIVSDRIVLLDGMTVAQNLALPFGLALEPVPAEVMDRVGPLAAEVGIDAELFATPIASAPPLLRSRVYLARALAFDPDLLVLEHPSANLSVEDAKEFAGEVRRVAEGRRLTVVGVLMDERFAKSTGGRLLSWQPATGEVRVRSALRFW